MNKKLKLSALALLAIAAAVPAHAETDLLQSVTVSFEYYSQGPGVVNHAGGTNYTVPKHSFGTKQLIGLLSSNGFQSGDVLVRVTPVTNVAVITTNLVPVSTNILVITNTSTSLLAVSNEYSFNNLMPTNIGNTNYNFGTNTMINGIAVVLTNYLYYGTSNIFIGTNTTVTTTTLTDSNGYNVGFSNVFVINAFTTTIGGTNELGSPYWGIFNRHTSPKITPITTNATFNIYTRRIYDDGTNLALMHGENIKHDGVIQYGTTDEIRSLVLSNSTWNIKLQGYSHGRFVPVNLGDNDTVHSQNYTWTGNGSGTTNSTAIVIEGNVSEQYFRQ